MGNRAITPNICEIREVKKCLIGDAKRHSEKQSQEMTGFAEWPVESIRITGLKRGEGLIVLDNCGQVMVKKEKGGDVRVLTNAVLKEVT